MTFALKISPFNREFDFAPSTNPGAKVNKKYSNPLLIFLAFSGDLTNVEEPSKELF
jgi:hypothetical protein